MAVENHVKCALRKPFRIHHLVQASPVYLHISVRRAGCGSRPCPTRTPGSPALVDTALEEGGGWPDRLDQHTRPLVGDNQINVKSSIPWRSILRYVTDRCTITARCRDTPRCYNRHRELLGLKGVSCSWALCHGPVCPLTPPHPTRPLTPNTLQNEPQ